MQLLQLLFFHPHPTQAIVKHVDMNWNSARFPRALPLLGYLGRKPCHWVPAGCCSDVPFQHLQQHLYPNWLQCPQGENVRASVPEFFPALLSFYMSIWQMSGKWLGFFLIPFGLRVSDKRPDSCNEQDVPSVSKGKGGFRT